MKKSKMNRVERYNEASQLKLMYWKFIQHKLAIIGFFILTFLYLLAIFCEFFSTHDPNERFLKALQCPPTKIHIIDSNGKLTSPFIYGISVKVDPITLRATYSEKNDEVYKLKFFARGPEYRMWGLFKMARHILIAENTQIFFIFGSDDMGRDLYSRIVYGARISLSVGLIGVFISFIIGCIFGSISGFFGGWIDIVMQRVIEFLMSIPTVPVWIALSVALPNEWTPLQIYFVITLILSIVSWTSLARMVRGAIISIREEDYVVAAKLCGADTRMIITRHLLPSFISNLIVSLTLAIPGMIIGETALSFLGLGLRPPVISWGVLLKNAQEIQSFAVTPWRLIPALFIIVAVLSFNFVGDGLRDAADPYK
jgi:peptide/nickel transport system permease protein